MSRTQPKIAAIILAAGSSKRMGKVKQLLPWKYTTLLGNSIEQALASEVNEVFVVLGSNYKLISKEIENHNITILHNKKWSQGMGFSISCAMNFISNNSIKYDGVLIILVDQPLIDIKYINKLIHKFIGSNIITSKYKKRVGVPAIFSSVYFNELSGLNRDIGARDLITEHINDVKVIDAFDKIQDIDSISSYKLLYQKFGNISG